MTLFCCISHLWSVCIIHIYSIGIHNNEINKTISAIMNATFIIDHPLCKNCCILSIQISSLLNHLGFMIHTNYDSIDNLKIVHSCPNNTVVISHYMWDNNKVNLLYLYCHPANRGQSVLPIAKHHYPTSILIFVYSLYKGKFPISLYM